MLDIRKLLDLKQNINDLPLLHFNTLKIHVYFFTKVVEREYSNRMNSYNIAVTVGPNIIRPEKFEKEHFSESVNVYGAFEIMIDHFDVLFDKKIS